MNPRQFPSNQINILYIAKRFPFDWKSPVRFLIAIGIHYVMLLYAIMIGACVLALAIGSYLYIIALNKCMKESLNVINQTTHDKINRIGIGKRLSEFIELHSNVKELSDIEIPF